MGRQEVKGQNRNIWFRDPEVLEGAAKIARKTHRTVNWVLSTILENEIASYLKNPEQLESKRPQQ